MRSGRDAAMAGTVPKKMPASSESATLNRSTVPSMLTVAARGRSGGATAISARTPHDPSSKPAAPPARDSSKLSASSWRTSRQRPAPSAERHRDLTGACCRTREQQVRDVDAGDQEHEADRAEENQQRPLHAFHHRVQQRYGAHRVTVDLVRILARQVLLDAVEIRARLGDGDTVAQPADGGKIVRAALVRRQLVGLEAQRDPDLAVAGEIKAGGEHADDLERRAFERDTLPDDRAVAAVAALPQIVPEQHHLAGARKCVGRGESATELRRHPQHAEKLRVDRAGGHADGLGSAAQREDLIAVDGDTAQSPVLRAPVHEVWGRDSRRAPLPGVLVDVHETGRLRERQRLQQYLLHHGEDGGVGADAERSREYRSDREARRLAQHAQREREVLCGHECRPFAW